MGSKSERELKLKYFPWRPKLITAGQKSSTEEGSLWKCRNAAPDFDGMMRKWPGVDQWGQTLMAPDATATGSSITSFSSFLSGLTGYIEGDTSSGLITLATTRGSLRTNVQPSSGSESYLLSYAVSSLSLNDTWSFRFMVRVSNVPDYPNPSTSANTFAFRVQGAAGSGKEFAIWSDGLYWQRASDSQYVKVTDSDFIAAGGWNAVEIRCDDTADTVEVYRNDVLLETLVASAMAAPSFTGTTAFEFEWVVEGTTPAVQYSTVIATPMYNDVAADAFAAVPVAALEDFQYTTSSSLKIRTLVAAAGNYIYHDTYLEGAWRPLHPKNQAYVYFADYRNSICWTDNNGATTSKVWQWTGVDDPIHLDTAPPARFLVEHQTRLLAWGDPTNPKRGYYSGDRKPNVWFNPSPTNAEDQFDELLDAGYVEIDDGTELRAIIGNFHGLAILAGDKGYWKMGGSGPFSYGLQGLRVQTGASNAEAFKHVGSDAWAVADEGIISIAATDQFGDVLPSFPSVPIQNLWNNDPEAPLSITKTFINKSRLVYATKQGTVLFAVPLTGDQGPMNLFMYSLITQGFYGPREIDASAMAVVEVASPVSEVVMVGGQDGRIGYFNPYALQDFGADGYEMEIETASFNGRSQDPEFAQQVKTWHMLRIWYIPGGDWDFRIDWWTERSKDTKTITLQQLSGIDRFYVLDTDFRLDIDPDNFLASGQELVMKRIPLDTKGRDLDVAIFQSGTNEGIGIQAIALEATLDGYEEQ